LNSAQNRVPSFTRSSRLLTRFIVTFLVTGSLLTGVLLLLANTLVSSIITRESNQAARAQLALSSRAAYYALTDVYGDFYTLWTKNADIQNALNARTFSIAEIDSISKLLDDVAFANTLVDSVCLINADADLVISNRLPSAKLADFADSGAIELYSQFEQQFDTAKQEVFFPRLSSININNQPVIRDYISLIFATMTSDRQLHASIIVNIDQSRLASLINADQENGQMTIVNRSGLIICDPGGGSFAQPLPSDNLFKTISASASASGSLPADYHGERSLISYQKAETLGFYFLNIIPYDQLLEPIRQTNQIMALLFGAAILLSLLISILSARQIYRPIGRLIRVLQSSPAVSAETELDEYAYLHSAFASLITNSEQSSLLRLLQGGSPDRMLEMLGLSRPAFLLAALLTDHPDTADDAWLDQVCQQTRRILRQPAAILPERVVAILWNADEFDDFSMDWLVSQLAELQQAIRETTGCSAAIGIGNVVKNPAAIKISLQNALAAAQYAAELGSGQIVPYSEMQTHPQATSQNRSTLAAAIDDYIQANFQHPGFSLDDIADHIGLSVGYLRQIFKIERGVPLNDYIIACRIRKACELLAGSEMTAKDISEAVGYLDSRYFYTLFKKKTGMTTDEYRRSRRQEDLHDQAE